MKKYNKIPMLISEIEELIEKENTLQAKKKLEILLSADNDNIDALNDLSFIQITEDELAGTEATLKKAISIDAGNETASNNLVILNKLKDTVDQI